MQKIIMVLVFVGLAWTSIAHAQEKKQEKAAAPFIKPYRENVLDEEDSSNENSVIELKERDPKAPLVEQAGDMTLVGLDCDMSGKIEPSKLRAGDRATLEQIIEVIESEIGPLDALGLTPKMIERSPLSEPSNRAKDDQGYFELYHFELEQILYQNRVSSLQVSVKFEGRNRTTVLVHGNVVDPNIQAVDPQFWISETEAKNQAIAELRSVTLNRRNADSLEELVEQGLVEGDFRFELNQTAEGYRIRPILRVRGDKHDADVDMLDGTTTVRERRARHTTNQLRPNVQTRT